MVAKIQQFTKYETARIIGARALQIAMDAPLLLKMSAKELEETSYDPLRIAEKELSEGVLPISINRPLPRKTKQKLAEVKEEVVTDEELIQKEQEVEKEIVEDAENLGFVEEEDLMEKEESASEEQ